MKNNLTCDACKEIITDNTTYYREDENETVCEECYISFLGERHDKQYSCLHPIKLKTLKGYRCPDCGKVSK